MGDFIQMELERKARLREAEKGLREEMAREAKADGIRDTMLFFGRQRLGEPSEAIDDALWNIDDPDKLLPIAKRIPEVASWEELLRGAP